jgi:maleate cis-trans isomerase
MTSESVPAFDRPRMYGHRARIGYTSPPLTTEVFPYEFYKIVPEGVTLVLTTLAITVRSEEEIAQSYDMTMKAVREMAASKVDSIVLGGVPINMSKGAANAEAMIRDLEAELGVPVATSASAQAKAVAKLGIKKLVLAHPYAARDTERIDQYSVKFGCEVLGSAAWGAPFNQIGRVPRDGALELGRRLMKQHPDADTIMFPSPHWPVIEAIEPLEREFGITVLASINAILWEGLRRAGIKDSIKGYGRLLRDF